MNSCCCNGALCIGLHLIGHANCTFLGVPEGSLLGEAALSLEPLTSRAKERSRPDIACIKYMYESCKLMALNKLACYKSMVYRCLREPGAILKQLWKLCKVSAHGKALYILYAGDGLFRSGPHVFCTLWQDLLCFSAGLSEDAGYRKIGILRIERKCFQLQAD